MNFNSQQAKNNTIIHKPYTSLYLNQLLADNKLILNSRSEEVFFPLEIAPANTSVKIPCLYDNPIYKNKSISSKWLYKMEDLFNDLLDEENWDWDLPYPTLGAFQAFFNVLSDLDPPRKPSIGATSDGGLTLSWINTRATVVIKLKYIDNITMRFKVTNDDLVELTSDYINEAESFKWIFEIHNLNDVLLDIKIKYNIIPNVFKIDGLIN